MAMLVGTAMIAAPSAWSADAPSAPARRRQALEDLLVRAERTLAAGRPLAAAALLEQAARLDEDDARAELAQVRAWLQSGDGAHARAWARLVAGEHRDAPAALEWADALESLARGLRPARDALPAVPAHPFPLPPPRTPREAPATEPTAWTPLGAALIHGPARRLLAGPSLARRLSTLPDGHRLLVADGTGALLRLEPVTGQLVPDDQDAEAPPSLRPAAPAPRATSAVAGRPIVLIEARAAGDRPPDGRLRVQWPRLRPGLLGGTGERGQRLSLPGGPVPDGCAVWDTCGDWLGWSDAGELAQASPGPEGGAVASCSPRLAMDVANHHDLWFPAAAVVWAHLPGVDPGPR